jgi:hypothetical protein
MTIFITTRKVQMQTLTNGAILERHEINTDGIEHLELECPILCGPQAQGDVLLVPVKNRKDRGERVPAHGVVVVRGESAGANAHILHALEGECFWAPAPNADSELPQGWLTVPGGCSATLIHTQEHNVIGVGPGTFELTRQREFAGEWRRVSD